MCLYQCHIGDLRQGKAVAAAFETVFKLPERSDGEYLFTAIGVDELQLQTVI